MCRCVLASECVHDCMCVCVCVSECVHVCVCHVCRVCELMLMNVKSTASLLSPYTILY